MAPSAEVLKEGLTVSGDFARVGERDGYVAVVRGLDQGGTGMSLRLTKAMLAMCAAAIEKIKDEQAEYDRQKEGDD